MPKRRDKNGQSDSSVDLLDALDEANSNDTSQVTENHGLDAMGPSSTPTSSSKRLDLIPIAEPKSEYEFHPIAVKWPRREGASEKELEASLIQFGLREPIVIYQGLILCGCNRDPLCKRLEIPRRYVEYVGNDPVGFAIDDNMTVRKDPVSARSIIAARLGTQRQGEKAYPGAVTQAQAAKRLGVSERMVQRAAALIDKASVELVEAVASSKVTLTFACDDAMVEDHESQRKLLEIMQAKRCSAHQALREVRGEPAADAQDTGRLMMPLDALPRDVRRRLEDDVDRVIKRLCQSYSQVEPSAVLKLVGDEVARLSA